MASLSQVAKEAGVSITTASFVLNGRGQEMRISADTIQRVERAAEALRYRSNYHARTLLSGRSQTLGLIMRPMRHHMVHALFHEGVIETARKRGYDILQIVADEKHDAFDRALSYIEERRIDGLISQMYPTPEQWKALDTHAARIRFVLTGPIIDVPYVIADPRPGLTEAVQHLASLGHRDLLWLGRKRDDGTLLSADRYECAQEVGASLGCRFQCVAVSPPEPSVQLAEEYIPYYYLGLMDAIPEPLTQTAIFCYNDNMAAALYFILQQRNLSIPNDVSVIGFDDTLAGHLLPPLTTISHRFSDMGAEAVHRVIHSVESATPLKLENAVLPTQLIVRESTGPV